MTKFSDQLLDDLMREHGPGLAAARVPAAPKRRVAHPVRLSAVAGGIGAVATAVGLLVPGGSTPAYAVTSNANGTVTLDVYDQSGIAGANQALQKMGDKQVNVVPVRSGCPSITSLPKVSHSAKFEFYQINGTSLDPNGKITINPHNIPKGETLLVPVEMIGKDTYVLGSPPKEITVGKTKGLLFNIGVQTRSPAPSCVSVPKHFPRLQLTGSGGVPGMTRAPGGV
jgi:hypothetical protein